VSLAVIGATLGAGDRPVGLRAEGDRIVAVGPDVMAEPGDELLDATGTALLPGLVNGHTHAAMTLFRGSGDDLPLMAWLRERIWPAEARLTADDVYWGTRLACTEMIRSGTVRFWDMYWHPDAVARAVRDAGLRAVVGAPLFDGADPDGSGALRADARASLDALESAGPLVGTAFAPHAIYTVSEPSLRWIASESEARGLPVQIHLSETRDEVDDCVAAHGVRPAAYLDRVGLLGPRTVLAHGVWLDDDELALVAARGATVVTNPASNLKLAVGGVFRYPAARAAGVAVGLGTDGAGSNDSLDLLADVKLLALVQKHAAGDPTAMTAAEAWAVATGARAPGLGASGRLAVGEPADLILVRRDAPELAIGDLTADLVYAASGAVVDATVVAGRVLMRGGVVEGAREIVACAAEHARRVNGGASASAS